MPHEIITLQLGNYSNYVAAHFWNIQVSSSNAPKTFHIFHINNLFETLAK